MTLKNYFVRITLSALLMLSFSILKAQVVINEYSCSNLSQIPDNYQEYGDWFELYNAGSSSVNLGGYYLSDDSLNNTKWQIPASVTIGANSFAVFWCSGRNLVSGTNYHTNFKLTQTKNNPEFIVLSDPSAVRLDYVRLSKKTQLGHSRGRTFNGIPTWSIFTTPTPNGTNNNSTAYFDYADRPDYSLGAGYYTGSVTVAIT
ncbi:MAG TPA: lamin tail domain-containing protein, partial [Bacteroidia bacterium]|nr:lamin tail domain-containing protein [Bacteroidia bacterium]